MLIGSFTTALTPRHVLRLCVATLLFLAVLPAFPAQAADHEFEDPENTRPRVVRYACCEGVDILDAPLQTGARLGRLDQQEQVYVFNLFGTGLPAGLGSCIGTPASCGTIWAEIYAVDQRISGFVPLNALFIRTLVPQADLLQYEAGFALLHNALADALDDRVITPEGCSDGANTELYRGSDFGGDSLLSLSRTDRRSCNAAIYAAGQSPLIPCTDMDPDAAQFDQCVYETEAECDLATPPDRNPATALNFCQPVDTSDAGACLSCRAWYDLTGQHSTGWQTAGALVDACLAGISDPQQCETGGGGGGTPGIGGGGQTQAIDGGFGFDIPPDGDPDPFDPPAPLESEDEGPQNLGAIPDTQAAGSACTVLCQNRQQTFMTSSCRNYIGINDAKYLTDFSDYACGEIPVGKTHPVFYVNLDTGGNTGTPDQDWKWLHTAWIKALSRPAILRMGRLEAQTGYTDTIRDLTSREPEHAVTVRQALHQEDFWFRLNPRRTAQGRDSLFAEACVLLPGTTIDSNPIRPDTTSALGLFVEEIDLGGVTIDKIRICQEYRISVNAGYRITITATDNGSAITIIEPGSLTGVDITYTTLTNGATLVAPIANVLLASLQVSTVVAERLTQSGEAEFLLQFALLASQEDIREAVVDGLKPVIDAAADQLNETVDIPDLLDRVCGDLAPQVALSNPTYWFNEFLRWQCRGFAADPNLRAFVPHSPSDGQGCYDARWYINPQDARSRQWWTPYQGQSWAYNLGAGGDLGCRVAGQISTALDRDSWPMMVCAMAMHNQWLNGRSFPRTAVLQGLIQGNCGGFVQQAIPRYYGNGDDLIELYIAANPPSSGLGGFAVEPPD